MLAPPLLAALLLTAPLLGCVAEPPEDDDESAALWNEFLLERESWLRALGEPILDCIAQEDTTSPAFHGCWDWHSAVHGVWATLALARLLDDDRYTDAADAVLTPEAVDGELARVESGGPFGEVPYGYAWLLRLARERDDAGRDDLLPHGRFAADRLFGWIEALSPSGIDTALEADDYINLSWALLHATQFADHDGDSARSESLRAFAQEEVLSRRCDVADDADALDNFFPPCLHRALVLSAVLDDDSREILREEFADGPPALPPLRDPTPAHAAGLNFSRAFGLWAVFDLTGDDRWRDAYVEHVRTHLLQPEYWRDDYEAHSHWIPQFGVFALSLPEASEAP